jgi:hypothetical protein
MKVDDPHLNEPDPMIRKQSKQWSRGWKQVWTTEAIFTTIARLYGASDFDSGNEGDYDQGCQYEVRISQDGAIDVFSTEEFKDPLKKAAHQKK